MISTSMLESLLKKAQEATQGEWEASHVNTNHKEVTCASLSSQNNYWITSDTSRQEDCEFIAAANPETIKQLVQCILEMKDALKESAADYYNIYSKKSELIQGCAKAQECLEKWFGTEIKEK